LPVPTDGLDSGATPLTRYSREKLHPPFIHLWTETQGARGCSVFFQYSYLRHQGSIHLELFCVCICIATLTGRFDNDFPFRVVCLQSCNVLVSTLSLERIWTLHE
jgi:hypothetical protein